MNPVDVYVYGMTVLPTIHKLKGDYPKADTYQEIEQTFIMPGGEAANSAAVARTRSKSLFAISASSSMPNSALNL